MPRPVRCRLFELITPLLIVSAHLPELHVKTVKYFKSIEMVQDEVERTQRELKAKGKVQLEQVGSME